MKKTIIAAAMIGILLPTTGTAENFKRIKTEADFLKLVADKTLTNEQANMIVGSNGKTKGKFAGKSFVAAWVWANRMYCRNAIYDGNDIGQDCQVVKISGNQVQFIRESGKGETGTMTIN